MDNKQRHEESICKRFIFLYNLLGNQLDFLRLGNPNIKEPDCICTNNVAIELVDVFDNAYQAEKLWNEVRNMKIKSKPNFLLKSLSDLSPTIGNKLYKLNNGNYNGFSGKLLLVCHLQSPLITDKEVELYLKEYSTFRGDDAFEKYFDEIWISWKSDNKSGWKISKLE